MRSVISLNSLNRLLALLGLVVILALALTLTAGGAPIAAQQASVVQPSPFVPEFPCAPTRSCSSRTPASGTSAPASRSAGHVGRNHVAGG